MTTQSPGHPDIALLAKAIERSARTIHRTIHRQLADIRTFDRAAGWELFGAKSCAHWLTLTLGLGPTTARERVRVARALAKLKLVDAALREGVLSFSKTRVLSRVATSDNEAMLLDMAKKMSNLELERFCRALRRSETPHAWQERFVRRRSISGSGMVRIEIQLESHEADTVWAALLLGARQAARTSPATPADHGGATTSTRYPAQTVVSARELPRLADALHRFACMCIHAHTDKVRVDARGADGPSRPEQAPTCPSSAISASEGAAARDGAAAGDRAAARHGAAAGDRAGAGGRDAAKAVEQPDIADPRPDSRRAATSQSGRDTDSASCAAPKAVLDDVTPCTTPAADATSCALSARDVGSEGPAEDAAPLTLASTPDGISSANAARSPCDDRSTSVVADHQEARHSNRPAELGGGAPIAACDSFTSRGGGPPSARG